MGGYDTSSFRLQAGGSYLYSCLDFMFSVYDGTRRRVYKMHVAFEEGSRV